MSFDWETLLKIAMTIVIFTDFACGGINITIFAMCCRSRVRQQVVKKVAAKHPEMSLAQLNKMYTQSNIGYLVFGIVLIASAIGLCFLANARFVTHTI